MRKESKSPVIIGTGYKTLSKVKENDGISLELNNDSHTIPYTEDGTWGNYAGCETKATLFIGNREENSNVVYTVDIPSNVTGTWNKTTRTLTVTKIETDTAFVDILATYTDVLTNKTSKYSRRFTMNKVRNGKDTILVGMSNDYHVFRCNADGEIEQDQGVSVYTTVSAFVGIEPIPKEKVQIKLRPLHPENHRDLKVELNGNDSIKFTAIKGVGLPQNGSYTFDVEVIKTDPMSNQDSTAKIPMTFAWNKINDGLPAVIASLTNDSHVVPSDKNGDTILENYDGCSTKIELFRGGKLVKAGVAYTFHPQSGVVEGSGDPVSGVYTVTNVRGLNGWVDLVAKYEGESYTCRFTITKAKQGIEGYTINMSNDTHVFPCQANGYVLEELVTETEIMVHLGVDPVPIKLGPLPTDIPGLKIKEIPTTVGDHIVKVQIVAAQGTDLEMNGNIDIPIVSLDEKLDVVKRFSWAKTKQGESSEYNYSQLIPGFDLFTIYGGSKWVESKSGWVNRNEKNEIKGFSLTTNNTKNTLTAVDNVIFEMKLTSTVDIANAYCKIDFFRDMNGVETSGKTTVTQIFGVKTGTNTYSVKVDCSTATSLNLCKSLYIELNVGNNECTLLGMVVKKMITPDMIPDGSIDKDKINTTGLTVPFLSNKVVKINESVGVEILEGKITVKDNAGSVMLKGDGGTGVITIKSLTATTLKVGNNDVYHTGNLPSASTSVKGVVQLYNGIDSSSSSLAATAGSVKTAYDKGVSAYNKAVEAYDKGNHSHPYAPTSHTHNYAAASHTHDYIPTSASCNKNWRWEWGNQNPSHIWGSKGSSSDFYVFAPSDLSVGYSSNTGKINGRTIFYGGTTPSGAKAGDIWFYY